VKSSRAASFEIEKYHCKDAYQNFLGEELVGTFLNRCGEAMFQESRIREYRAFTSVG
jgi:hypothetical protein